MKRVLLLIITVALSTILVSAQSLEVDSAGNVNMTYDVNIEGTLTVEGGVPLPAGYIYGLECAWAVSAANECTFAAGECRDSSNSVDIRLASNMTKDVSSAWVAGDGNGGCFVAPDDNVTMHHFVIMKADGTVDAGFDTSPICTNIPPGYIYYRRVCSNKTQDTNGGIVLWEEVVQRGDFFFRKERYQRVDDDEPSSSPTYKTLYRTPRGLNLIAIVHFGVRNNDDQWYRLHLEGESDEFFRMGSGGYNSGTQANVHIPVGSNTVIGYSSSDTNISSWLRIYELGWIDQRGKDGGL